MRTGYFEHDADIGVIGQGSSLEESFEAAARAMFAIITHIEVIQPHITVTFEFDESDPELALVIWLNQILGKARELGMVFGHFRITRQGNHWHGTVLGEKWREGLERGVEVKGATLTMLSVKQINTHWESRCVVDV